MLGYVDQSHTLNANNTVWQEISRGQEQIMVGKREINAGRT